MTQTDPLPVISPRPKSALNCECGSTQVGALTQTESNRPEKWLPIPSTVKNRAPTERNFSLQMARAVIAQILILMTSESGRIGNNYQSKPSLVVIADTCNCLSQESHSRDLSAQEKHIKMVAFFLHDEVLIHGSTSLR